MPTEYRELEWQLRRLEVLRRVVGGRIVSKAGLERGRLPILEYLEQHNGCSQRDIAEIVHISPPSVAVTLRRMEAAGLVRREADAHDQRVNRIFITPEGRRLTVACRGEFDKINARMFDGFSAEELDSLAGYVERLFENLSEGEDQNFPFYPKFSCESNQNQEETDA